MRERRRKENEEKREGRRRRRRKNLRPLLASQSCACFYVQRLASLPLLKSGSRGVLVVQRVSGVDNVAAWSSLSSPMAPSSSQANELVTLRHHPAPELNERQTGTVTGAGDNLAGAILAGLVRGIVTVCAARAGSPRRPGSESKEAVADHPSLREVLP
ncbi:LOW QUALITY PROTEIN: hypothetical protein RTBOTA2_000596 [Rhodotorula toruloides]|nr:LOW QUALITY PROTEIN: hypothetical protein RTBOTA2_000596 [Rhodotorula toruloides]